MKVIVAGPRDFYDLRAVTEAIESSGFHITQLVSGCAKGVDNDGLRWACQRGIPTKMFPAKWDEHGRAAGPIRNREMAEYADALVAVWDGKSHGTKNMIETAKAMGLKVYVHFIKR